MTSLTAFLRPRFHSQGMRRRLSSWFHGTTQGLNAVLQRRGERVLLLATEGVGDAYFIARGNRDRLYDIHYHKPVPLVPRHDVVEIPGRFELPWGRAVNVGPKCGPCCRCAGARGQFRFDCCSVPFQLPQSRARIACAGCPPRGIRGGIPITLSHEVAREWREYERTSSAYWMPISHRPSGAI